jgi:hypothetical protein
VDVIVTMIINVTVTSPIGDFIIIFAVDVDLNGDIVTVTVSLTLNAMLKDTSANLVTMAIMVTAHRHGSSIRSRSISPRKVTKDPLKK